jgi:hypothetical protein
MTTWEYLKTEGDAELAMLGQQGWELVAVVPAEGESAPVCYFKRPAPDFRDRVTLDQKQRYYTQRGRVSTAAGTAE